MQRKLFKGGNYVRKCGMHSVSCLDLLPLYIRDEGTGQPSQSFFHAWIKVPKCALLSLVWQSSFSYQKKHNFFELRTIFLRSGKNPFWRHCTYFEFYTQTNVTKDLRLFQEFYTFMQMYSKSIKKIVKSQLRWHFFGKER